MKAYMRAFISYALFVVINDVCICVHLIYTKGGFSYILIVLADS